MSELLRDEHLDRFFQDYVGGYNQALTDAPDYQRIRNYFAPEFIAAGPKGAMTGKNDEAFGDQIKQGYAFYKAVGTKQMSVSRVERMAIDPSHALAKVFYHADYEPSDGRKVGIDFDISYLVQAIDGAIKIIAFVAGDEMGVYRRHGLIDGDGKPV